MKKIYVLLSAACVAVSASAVEKQMAVAEQSLAGVELVKESVSPKADSKAFSDLQTGARKLTKSTRAGSDYVYFRPANNVMAIGLSTNGYGLRSMVGFASSYGSLDFYNYTQGASSFEWNYNRLNDYEVVGSGENAEIVFNWSTANTRDLSIKSGVGQMATPELAAAFPSGESSYAFIEGVEEYLCGGGADYWVQPSEAAGQFGVTFYQNMGITSPQGFTGSLTYFNSYAPNDNGFNEFGAYVDPNARKNWKTRIEDFQIAQGKNVTDIAIENFTFFQPAPASTYFMTRAWMNVQIAAASDTQLVSNIYPVDEEGYMGEMPIAVGYAAIPKGQTLLPLFEYFPLDENGDEIEGEVFIDSDVAITIEGFAGNESITSIDVVSGYYPFSADEYMTGNYDICKEADLYVGLSFKLDDEYYSTLMIDNGLYFFDQSGADQDTLSAATYAKVYMNATFAFIYEENGVEEVTIPAEGGSADLTLNALYYNIPQMIEEEIYQVTAPEWVNVSFGEVNRQDYTTPMTVSVEASAEGRTGVVTIEGMGATYSLTVNQGEGNAVSSISIDKNAQYFDLQGRKVANPDKGIYIKKTANKSEKVIL